MVAISIYGIVGAGPAGNEELLQELFKFIHALRHGAWAVGGDWNLTPQEVAEHHLTVASRGRVHAPGRATTEGGREIDFFLVGPAVPMRGCGAALVEDTPLPTHDAVELRIAGPICWLRVAAISRPRAPGTATQLEEVREAIRSGKKDKLRRALGHIDSEVACQAEARLAALPSRWASEATGADKAFSEWNRFAEAYLFAAATGAAEPPPGGTGRGEEVRVIWRTLRPKVDNGTGADVGARAARWASAGRRLGRLAALCSVETLVAAQERSHLLARLSRTCSEQQLGSEHFGQDWHSLMERVAREGPDELQVSAGRAHSIAAELARQRRKQDDLSWAQWSLNALRAGAAGAAAFARDERPMDTVAADIQGQIVFDPQRIAEAALEAWTGIWKRVGETHAPGAVHAARSAPARPGDDCLGHEPLPPLTGEAVRRAACGQAGRGCGFDHWTSEELRTLPVEAFNALTAAHHLVEEEGAFLPQGLGTIEILFSKGKGDEPLMQRNIGLLPCIYRVWAAARQPVVKRWRKDHGYAWAWSTDWAGARQPGRQRSTPRGPSADADLAPPSSTIAEAAMR